MSPLNAKVLLPNDGLSVVTSLREHNSADGKSSLDVESFVLN
jgi:hypothetical protein